MEEQQYLDLVSRVMSEGTEREDRTGTGTIALFGCQTRWDLRKGFPLLTTKKMNFDAIVLELLWFISGNTNGQRLLDEGVKIWESNGSREYLDKVGFHDRKEHDLGPIYGFQWRHYGAVYTHCDDDYDGKGIDQLATAIHLLKTDPFSRRIIVCAWNPRDLKSMALPPCHMSFQFLVEKNTNGRLALSCVMTQRSADIGLGVPYNIASYALLTHMVAQVCDMEPKELIHCTNDTHVYKDHIEPLQLQAKRTPLTPPQLWLNPSIKSIDDFRFEDIQIKNYLHSGFIKMKMST
jgi:thymidylate synthase